MSDVLIIQHVAHEGPGYLSEFFDKQGISYRLIAMDSGEALPTSLDGARGLVLMGGPMSVNDDLPWLDPVLALIKSAFDDDIPVLGHCLGGQLMAKALGETIYANPVPEYGWLPVQVTNSQQAQDWFGTSSEGFAAFHWHGETFNLPAAATRVLSSKYCQNQAFIYDKSLAMQCHIEMTADLVREWVRRADDSTLAPSESIQSRHEMLENLDNKITTLQLTADRVYGHWLEGLR